MTKEKITELNKEDWPTRKFPPTIGHIAGAIGLMFVGFSVTMAIARFSHERKAVLVGETKNSS